MKVQKEYSNKIKIYYRKTGKNRKDLKEIKDLKDQLDHLYNGEREDGLLAFYLFITFISPERHRLELLLWSGWEFAHRQHILIKAFSVNTF